jgi:hypothetical protein
LGALQKIRNQLTQDLEGASGADPAEIAAYQKANLFSQERSKIMESSQMRDFYQSGDSTGLKALVRQGPEGADAAGVLIGAAQAKYGSDGLLAASKDWLRQRYSDAVAPHGYVSLRDHDNFLKTYGGVLGQPEFADVRNQFNAAARAEGDVNAAIGFNQPGGFGKSASTADQRVAKAESYLATPMDVVMKHLENVQSQGIAGRRVLDQLQAGGPEAQLGYMHVLAGKALADPDYARKNLPLFQAADKVNDSIYGGANQTGKSFSQRAQDLSEPTSKTGIFRKMVDLAASYVGAQMGGHVAQHTGSSMVMAGRGAGAMRDVVHSALSKASGLTSAAIVDPTVLPAWQRLTTGSAIGNTLYTTGSKAKDILLMHSYVPGFYLGNLDNPGSPTGSGLPGAPTSPSGPLTGQGNSLEQYLKQFGGPSQTSPSGTPPGTPTPQTRNR